MNYSQMSLILGGILVAVGLFYTVVGIAWVGIRGQSTKVIRGNRARGIGIAYIIMGAVLLVGNSVNSIGLILFVVVWLVIINVGALLSYTAPKRTVDWTPEPGTEGDWEEEPRN